MKRFEVLLTFLLWLAIPLSLDGQDSSVPVVDADVLVRQYLDPSTEFNRLTEITLKLVEQGEDSRQRLHDAIQRQLQALTKRLKEPDVTGKKEIVRMRAKLKQIRDDPGLSEAKLRKEAGPMVRRLDKRVSDRQRKLDIQRRASGDAIKQLAEIRASFVELEKRWQAVDEQPIPVSKLLQRVEPILEAQDSATRRRACLKENAELVGELPVAVSDGIEALNKLRFVCGLDAVSIDLDLCDASADHARDMRTHDFFSHQSPIKGKETFVQRAKLAGTTASGENILMGVDSGRKAIEFWFFSPAHHRIMFAEYRRVGLGRAQKHWTMMVGR